MQPTVKLVRLPIDHIHFDPDQVRRSIDEQSLEGLARSIQEVGLLQPVLVRPQSDGHGYRLIAGERRVRAAQSAGYREIDALVILSGRLPVTQVQLIENLQREELNPIDRAVAIKRWMDEEGLSKLAASERLGVPRTTLTDWLDVLEIKMKYRLALLDNFQGGDSPLTLSHIAEARGLANKLNSPHIVDLLLDAVLQYKLSKAETRQIAHLIRSNRNLSMSDAIKQVRPPFVDDEAEARDGLPETPAVQARKLLMTMDRLRSGVAQMVLGTYEALDEIDKRRVLSEMERMRNILEDTIRRVTGELTPDQERPSGPERGRGKKKKRRTVASVSEGGPQQAVS